MILNYKKIEIYYTINGKGNPLILLHGFLHSSKMWIDYTDELKSNFLIIAIDLPGHGKSGVIENVTIKEMAEIVNLILENENLDSVSMIGHSMGGYTALAFAEIFPKKLNKLILLHSSAFADSEAVKKKRDLSLKILDRHPSMFVKSTIEYLYTKENLGRLKTEVFNDVEDAKAIGYLGYIEATKAMRDRPDRTRVFKTEITISIIAGEFDKVIELSVSESQINMLKNGSGVILKNVSHMGFVEEKVKCLSEINLILLE